MLIKYTKKVKLSKEKKRNEKIIERAGVFDHNWGRVADTLHELSI